MPEADTSLGLDLEPSDDKKPSLKRIVILKKEFLESDNPKDDAVLSEMAEEVPVNESQEEVAHLPDLRDQLPTKEQFWRRNRVFRISLLSLIVLFQAFTIAFFHLFSLVLQEEPSFTTFLIRPNITSIAILGVAYNSLITVLGILILLQFNSYQAIYFIQALLNIVIGCYVFHYSVYLVTTEIFMRNSLRNGTLVHMLDELRRFKNYSKPKLSSLVGYWNLTQKKYNCCAFSRNVVGLDYIFYPDSCCPKGRDCSITNKFHNNCFTAEMHMGNYYIRYAKITLSVAIPYVILLWIGFRFFRDYWIAKDDTSVTSSQLFAEMQNEGQSELEAIEKTTAEGVLPYQRRQCPAKHSKAKLRWIKGTKFTSYLKSRQEEEEKEKTLPARRPPRPTLV